MSTVRRYIFFAALPLIVGLIIISAWSRESIAPSPTAEPVQEVEAVPHVLTLEERAFGLQAQILFGATEFTRKTGTGEEFQQYAPLLQNQMQTVLDGADEFPKVEGKVGEISRRYLDRKKAIVAANIGQHQRAVETIETLIDMENRSAREKAIDELIAHHILPKAAPDIPIEPLNLEQRLLIQTELEWFGSMFETLVAQNAEELENARTRMQSQALKLFERIVVLGTAVAIVAVLAILSFIYFVFRFFTGRAKPMFAPGSLNPQLLLEVFVLYLLGMYLFSMGTELVFRLKPELRSQLLPHEILRLHGIGILCLLFLLVWPVFSGAKFREVRQAIGLEIQSVGKAIRDVIVAPFYYFASWIVLGTVLIIYGLIMTYLKVDITQGAHPMVPLLAGSSDPRLVATIVIIAVVVAPVVEEIMFRGAFYTWLRSKMGAAAAIFISAIVFAVLHPQGAIGIVPLATVGIALAFLREWRQTLIAPMIAHAFVNAGTLAIAYSIFS
jgi:membrane protease YdiL (CAAX protease family)